MKSRQIGSLLLTGALAISSFTGCAAGTATEQKESKTGTAQEAEKTRKHEPITIMDGNRDYTRLIELVEKKYPEIDLRVEAYQGANTTEYMSEQLEMGDMPDIYSSTEYWNEDWQKEQLVDLSGYNFTEAYNEVRMDECDVDGSIYLIPYDYQVISMFYNKTLFEKNNWKVPESFEELEQLVPELKKAGVRTGVSMDCLPGYGFQFFFNVADTVYLCTNEGRQWKKDFLAGKTGAADNLEECKDYFQKWIDTGLIDRRYEGYSIEDVQNEFYQGNAAFFIGGLSRYTQNEDGTGDQYGVLPYLSEDGSQNMYIILVSRYYGLNKKLMEKGNEQKLEDALHVLEIMSTSDGYSAVVDDDSAELSTLKDVPVSEENPYYDAMADMNEGHTAPFAYPGWENYIVTFGEKVQDWVDGKCTGDEAIAVLDEIQQSDPEKNCFGKAEDDFDTHQCALLTGEMFLDATDADYALISENEWKKGISSRSENKDGVNGKLYKGDITDEQIVVFLPTGWYGTIQTVTLTGKRLRELDKTGYDRNGDGDTYPYTLVSEDGTEPEDDRKYTVAVCGATDEILEEGDVQDTGIVGLDAAKKFLKSRGTISVSMLDGKEVN